MDQVTYKDQEFSDVQYVIGDGYAYNALQARGYTTHEIKDSPLGPLRVMVLPVEHNWLRDVWHNIGNAIQALGD